jgi:hypothetical protein
MCGGVSLVLPFTRLFNVRACRLQHMIAGERYCYLYLSCGVTGQIQEQFAGSVVRACIRVKEASCRCGEGRLKQLCMLHAG